MTYYVDSSITDTNVASATPDFTAYNPTTFSTSTGSDSVYKTIADVNLKSFAAGDSILFRKGQTWREQLTVPTSGSLGNRITYGTFGSGADPVINCADVQATWTSEAQAAGTDLSADANLYGSWYFDNAVTDGSGRGNTLTNTGSATFSTTTKKQGTHSLSVNGTSQYATLVDGSLSAGFPGKTGTTNTDLTFGTWVYFNGFSSSGGVIGKSAGTSGYVITTLFTTGIYKFKFSAWLDGSERTVVGRFPLMTGRWYHIAGRISSSTKKMEIFEDGNLKATESYTATSTTLSTGGTDWRIGQSNYAGAYSNAYFDEAWIFNRALTNNEIKGIYTGGLNGAGISGFTSYRSNTATYAADPLQVFQVDGATTTRLTKVIAATLLTPGSWYYDSSNTRVYVRTTADDLPSNHVMELSARTYGIYNSSNKTYLVLDGLHVTQAKSFGISLATSTGSTVQNCTSDYNYDFGISVSGVADFTAQANTLAYNGADGINLQGGATTNFLVSKNIVHHNCQLGLNTSNQDTCGAIRLGSVTLGSGTISDNLVYSTEMGGTDAGNGIHMDTNPSSGSVVTITRNRIYGNAYNGIIIEAGRNTAVTYNVVTGNIGTYGGAGVLIFRSPGPNQVYNNTSYGNSVGLASYGDGSGLNQTNNSFRNNISFGSLVFTFAASYGGQNDGTNGSGNVYTNNALGVAATNFIQYGSPGVFQSTYAAWETAYGGTTSSVQTDPLFTNAGANDFTLQSGSPAINAGANLGTTYQAALLTSSTWPTGVLTANQNSYGVGWEMGAYLFGATGVRISIIGKMQGRGVIK